VLHHGAGAAAILLEQAQAQLARTRIAARIAFGGRAGIAAGVTLAEVIAEPIQQAGLAARIARIAANRFARLAAFHFTGLAALDLAGLAARLGFAAGVATLFLGEQALEQTGLTTGIATRAPVIRPGLRERNPARQHGQSR
jgi:hypothetical protein